MIGPHVQPIMPALDVVVRTDRLAEDWPRRVWPHGAGQPRAPYVREVCVNFLMSLWNSSAMTAAGKKGNALLYKYTVVPKCLIQIGAEVSGHFGTTI